MSPINVFVTATLAAAVTLLGAGCTGHQRDRALTPIAASSGAAEHYNASQQAVNAVLDELHAQAAAANFKAYFDLYAPNAVFLGTDRTEYWPLEEFKIYSKPRFQDGGGWTYTPLTRELHFFENTAWFEEELESQNYGRVRGTGVLVRLANGWKVAQYNLTLPIPNDLFEEAAKEIKAYYRAPATSQAQP